MSTSPTDPVVSESRPSSIWRIGLYSSAALFVLFALIAVVLGVAWPMPPRFPRATVCLSETDGHEFAWCGLQDPKGPRELEPLPLQLRIRPQGMKVTRNGTSLKIDWRYLGTSALGDSYEFQFAGTSIPHSTQRLFVTDKAQELIRMGEIVATIREYDAE